MTGWGWVRRWRHRRRYSQHLSGIELLAIVAAAAAVLWVAYLIVKP